MRMQWCCVFASHDMYCVSAAMTPPTTAALGEGIYDAQLLHAGAGKRAASRALAAALKQCSSNSR
jgi:hypothetical protein